MNVGGERNDCVSFSLFTCISQQPPIPKDCSPALTNLLNKCWDSNPRVSKTKSLISCLRQDGISAKSEIVSPVSSLVQSVFGEEG